MVSFDQCSLLSVQIAEGRKHQIRRHLQGIGHSIVGDRRYPQRKGRRALKGSPDRLWLHASRLTLDGVGTIQAPLPYELQCHLKVLGMDSDLYKSMT